MSFGDVDRDCDGTLLLSEQGNPTSIRRTVELPPPDQDDGAVDEAAAEPVEDRFEPTDFVRGSLVDFDTTSEQGGTIREGSLVYTPPEGFTGQDRFTFFYDDGEWIREAEVIVDVRFAEPSDEASPSPSPSPSPVVEETADRAEQALAESALASAPDGDRWDPPWLAWLTTMAAALVGLAVLWWLFLEVRIQDRLRS